MTAAQRAFVVAHSLACMKMLDHWTAVLGEIDPCGALLTTAVEMWEIATANYFELINCSDPKVG